jgi:hypothetical protein
VNPDIRNFVLSVLDDDFGISETAWFALNDMLQGLGEFFLLGEMARQVRETDGRFYIKDGR